MGSMSAHPELAVLLNEPGWWTYAYVDGSTDAEPAYDSAWRDSVRASLREAGAPVGDLDAVDRALDAMIGATQPTARYVLVREGRIELDESFAGARRGPERLGHRPVPELLPYLRHTGEDVLYAVVETGREGAELRVESLSAQDPEWQDEVVGRDDSLPKVRGGGMSHARMQRYSENVWTANQAEVADVVDRLVVERSPAFVAVAGDVRARQLLVDRLSERSRELVVDVDVHTRAAGADDTALREAIDEAATAHVDADANDVLDRAAHDSHRRGASGTDAVLEALQRAQVDTLLLDAGLADADATLYAFDDPPWAGLDEGESFGARQRAVVPVGDALARAAVLSGARVIVGAGDDAGDDDPAVDEPRPSRPDRPPFALLRWIDDGSRVRD